MQFLPGQMVTFWLRHGQGGMAKLLVFLFYLVEEEISVENAPSVVRAPLIVTNSYVDCVVFKI